MIKTFFFCVFFVTTVLIHWHFYRWCLFNLKVNTPPVYRSGLGQIIMYLSKFLLFAVILLFFNWRLLGIVLVTLFIVRQIANITAARCIAKEDRDYLIEKHHHRKTGNKHLAKQTVDRHKKPTIDELRKSAELETGLKCDWKINPQYEMVNTEKEFYRIRDHEDPSPITDNLYVAAKNLAIKNKSASLYLFERRFSISFALAKRLTEKLVKDGVIIPDPENGIFVLSRINPNLLKTSDAQH